MSTPLELTCINARIFRQFVFTYKIFSDCIFYTARALVPRQHNHDADLDFAHQFLSTSALIITYMVESDACYFEANDNIEPLGENSYSFSTI